MTMSVGK